MGRLFGLILVTPILIPFFADAQQVDQDRRSRLTDLLASSRPSLAHAAACRPSLEACGDEATDD